MLLRPLPLLLLIGSAACSEQGPTLATETVGEGVRNGVAQHIHAGQEVDAGSHLARLNLANGAKGFILLGTDTAISLKQVEDQGKPSLDITILSGRIEVSLDARGPYADVHVIAASTDTRVVGTLFIIERMPHDQDYVAVMHGHVSVRVRGDITAAVAGGSRDHAEITDHQGVLGGPSGISAITDELTSRPQLSGSNKPVQAQGTTPGNADWAHDAALATLDAEIAAIASATLSVSDYRSAARSRSRWPGPSPTRSPPRW